MKICSTSLIRRDKEIKTPISYYLTPIRMALIKKTNDKYWQDCEERGHLFIFGGNICNPMDYSLQAALSMGILQARILKCVAMPSSRGFS